MSNNLTEREVTIAEAVALLDIILNTRDPITGRYDSSYLWGKPGIGKSDIVLQAGDRRRWKVIEFHAALRETVDLRGIPVGDLATGKTKWLIPDELPQVERDGEEGILFCDEFNQATPQMQAVMTGLLLYGSVGDYRLPPGWRVVAAGNRVSDRAAAQRMPTHIRNRFHHIFIVENVEAWATWANANNVAPELVAFVRLRRELLHMMPKGDENAFPTPRTLTKCAKYIDAPKSHRLRLFAGLIGDAVAAELDGFIEVYRSIGSLEQIASDPDSAPIPKEPSARYAVCTGLGRIADRKNFPNVIRYAKRLNHRESEALIVFDATGRDESLKNTACYGSWAVQNQDIVAQIQ